MTEPDHGPQGKPGSGSASASGSGSASGLAAWAEPTAIVRALPFMAGLPAAVRNLVLAGFEERTYRFGETVLAPEDEAFVVVVEGEARAIADGPDGTEISLGLLGPGETSGERALVEDDPPRVTLRAASAAVRVLRLDRAVARALARAHPEAAAGFSSQARAKRIGAFLRMDSTFSQLDAAGLGLLVARGRDVAAQNGEVIVAEGDQTDHWWIVQSGRLVEQTGHGPGRRDVRFLRAGDVFGEVGALRSTARLTSVTAVDDCSLLELDSDVLAELGEHDRAFADRLDDRARLHLSRIAVRPLDFGGGDVLSGVKQRPPPPAPPSEDARIAVGVELVDAPQAPAPWIAPRRFPLVRQIDFADCGAAALAMVCRAFGRKVSLTFLRQEAGTGQEGTTLRGIMRGATRAGLEGHALKASKDRLDDLQLPAIVHWDGNHWVVLYAIDGDHVRIADPARGLRRYTRTEFTEKWSGWSATFRPTPALDDAPVERLEMSWLRPFVAPLRAKLAIATVMAIVATALDLVAPVLTQHVVDSAAKGDSGRVSLIVAVIVALLLVGLAISLVQRRMLARAAVRLDGDALDFVSGRLLDLPLAYFEARRTADIERRLNGLRQVRSLLVQGIVGGLSAVIQLVVSLVIMFSYSVVIGAVFIATAPVYAGLMRYSSRRLRPTFDSLEEAYSRHAAKQLDAIKGIEAAKSAGAEDGLQRGIRDEFSQLSDRVFRGDWVLMFYGAAVQLAGFLLFVLFLWVGALLVASHKLTIGQLVAVNSLVLLANAPIGLLLGLFDQLQQAAVLLQRLQDVLEAEPEQRRDVLTPRNVRRLSGRIALRQVELTYPDTPERKVLDGVSLVLEPGSTLGLVGRSGSGKSTLVRCLAGLVVPSGGNVLYDEVDMRELDWRQLRRRIGVVLQAPYLFDDTIAANIALGEPVPDPALVQRAAEIADAAGFIESLALGYETKVGDSGMRLSGGQAQRVCIARALYHDPPVLLFDEATSALDTESEAAVKRNLDRVLEQRTAVIVAHRLSTIRDADVIAVLEQGRLVEHGTHDELLAREGLYHHLHASQIA
jgi:ABC-type bacteriocin/lantibiotic exporter with double-glycine peptidase domain/CRP-like cAMP-binding protein